MAPPFTTLLLLLPLTFRLASVSVKKTDFCPVMVPQDDSCVISSSVAESLESYESSESVPLLRSGPSRSGAFDALFLEWTVAEVGIAKALLPSDGFVLLSERVTFGVWKSSIAALVF